MSVRITQLPVETTIGSITTGKVRVTQLPVESSIGGQTTGKIRVTQLAIEVTVPFTPANKAVVVFVVC